LPPSSRGARRQAIQDLLGRTAFAHGFSFYSLVAAKCVLLCCNSRECVCV
jgi:hypothetical protein